MRWYEKFDEWAAEQLPEMTVLKDEPLSRHCSFRIGGNARRMAFPRTAEELTRAVMFAREQGGAPLLLGNGTNVLFPDEELERLVVATDELTDIKCQGEVLTAQCGVTLARLAVCARSHALTGLEFAHGIPGSVGGAVVMNAGAYGGEIKDVLVGAELMTEDGTVRFFPVEELALGYRRSLLSDRPECAVLSATFRLSQGDEAEIRGRMEELMARRMASQPLEYPSAGSTFKRPEGAFAGTLIDRAGLKGLRFGGAVVSEKHAGFVINTGGATSADVKELIRQIQQRVQQESGILLETEVRMITEEE